LVVLVVGKESPQPQLFANGHRGAEVTFVDAKGRSSRERIQRRGEEFKASRFMMKSILEKITQRGTETLLPWP